MYYNYDDEKINYYGRWGKYDNSMASTTTGAYFEFTAEGGFALLHFNVDWMTQPYPHLYISVDGGHKVEVPVERMIRIQLNDDKAHKITVLIKSAVENQHRWYFPLVSKVSFMGAEAEKIVSTPEDTRKTMEIVGDSITEGVLVDENNRFFRQEVDNRVLQDDVTATYGYLAASELGFRPIMMGYGAVGVTKSGSGSVPKAALAYPYCFDGVPVTYDHPDYILINHGANDSRASAENYVSEYRGLLDVVFKLHPDSKVIVLSAFCGAHNDALGEFIKKYNEETKRDVLFISSKGWVPREPLHPQRDGHKTIAHNLVKILKDNGIHG